MGQALYRKYRSKQLSEIVGQEHITDTLNRALQSGKINHAYLFTGPKGVGKTSVARILAHAVNGLDYTDESSHLDIIEIDAASNRRIDEIRDLREKVHIAPTSSKYKIYIIDEVHMLTKEAFNALLKTLEEPPEHVIFILATTEASKLPDTIISRTQRFTFKAIDNIKAVEHLRFIAKKEKIKIDDDALELLAVHSNGSFRDSISLLEQVSHHSKQLTKSEVEKLIGIAPEDNINQLLEATLTSDPASLTQVLDSLIGQGVTSLQIAKQLAAKIREAIVTGNVKVDFQQALQLLAELIDIPSSVDPSAQLEVVLYKANLSTNNAPKAEQSATIMPNETVVKKEEAIYKADTLTEVMVTKASIDPSAVDKLWPALLKEVKKQNNTLYSVLRMGRPEMGEDSLSLSFSFSFHTKKIANKDTQSKLQAIIKSLTGRSLKIVALHDKNMAAPQIDIADSPAIQKSGETSKDLKVITSIFGGGEVIEA